MPALLSSLVPFLYRRVAKDKRQDKRDAVSAGGFVRHAAFF